ncbi:MAG: SDR family oxidoreductase [bacterium]
MSMLPPVTLIGASRGLGRHLAETFHHNGHKVLVVARGQAGLDALARDLPGLQTLAVDAAAPDAPAKVFAVQTPGILIVCGGDMPACLPFQDMDWDTFSGSWNNELQSSFNFLKAAVTGALPAGSTVLTITSGAMLQGSPISGGYAGAKKMQMFLSGYAQKEAGRAGLDLRFLTLAPARLMPATAVGAAGVKGYAAYNNTTEAGFLALMGPGQTVEQVADAVVQLIATGEKGGHYIVSPEGLAPLS